MSGASLIERFGALEDPRQSWKVLFPLPEVLLLVLCGTLAGAEDFVEIRRWGQMHRDFLRRRDCREFRVWSVMMGKKELPHGPTQSAADRG